jgi:hypothetical protein
VAAGSTLFSACGVYKTLWAAGPGTPLGEDRAFFDALRRVDARIRHVPGVRVVVSARIVGRAPGGMADTMRRRVE